LIPSFARLPLRDLLAALKSGDVSAEELMIFYCARAAAADARTNSVTEDRFAAAIAAARRADDLRKRSGGKSLGALHGLPVSIKESLKVEGWSSTLGVAHRCFKPYAEHAVIVERMVELGAIPFVHTNLPQTMLSFECSNPVYGATTNPWDMDRSPGGSSGGESALVSAGGSPMGIGTDMGGSVRIPAAFCGLAGFKPTRDRISIIGGVSPMPGQIGIPGVILGPIGRCVDDLAVVFATWCGGLVYERDRIPPMPFRKAAYRDGPGGRPLRIGFYTHDGAVDAHPAYVRAVEETAAGLRAAGHIVERFNVPMWEGSSDMDASKGADSADPAADAADGHVPCNDGHVHPHDPVRSFLPRFFALVAADGGETIGRELAGEIVEENLRLSLRSIKLPRAVKTAVAGVLDLIGQGRIASFIRAMRGRSVADYWKLIAERNAFRQRFDVAFRAARLDALLSPAHALPAVPTGSSGDLSPTCSYTMLYNILDWPAGVVPVTRVSKLDERALTEQVPHRRLRDFFFFFFSFPFLSSFKHSYPHPITS
jgi:fatty acid amide hydrolase